MYEVALRRREPVAEGTLAFYFDKPAGFSHEAGQNAIFTLVEPPAMDAAGPSRPFTIASAPHEPELMIATRVRDTALQIAKLLGVDWAARVDFIYDQRRDRLCFLECDVAPMLGLGSAFADSLLAAGMAREEQLRLILGACS